MQHLVIWLKPRAIAVWLSTYRSFNIQLNSSDYSKSLFIPSNLYGFLYCLLHMCYICVLIGYCIQTIILCLPTFFTCLHFLHSILLLSNMLYRSPIYSPSFDMHILQAIIILRCYCMTIAIWCVSFSYCSYTLPNSLIACVS